jgi:hypothetical protein
MQSHARAVAGILLCAAALSVATSRALAQTPVFGLHAGGPVGASAAVGIWVGEDPRRDQAGGAIALVEPGLHGGRASVGYAYALRGGWGSFVTARATALRTWRRVGGPRNYGGLEVQVLPIFAVGPRVGAYVPADRGPKRVLWMLDFGVGL